MRKISANYIFPVSSPPLEEGVVTVSDEGTIIEIAERTGYTKDEVEIYEGVIVPGFINTHCHLELSHMKGMLQESTGLMPFIKGILSKRDAPADVIEDAIIKAEKEMIINGIVAVGDISNTRDTFSKKQENKLIYHTFVEVFNLVPEAAEATFAAGLALWNELNSKNQQAAIVPHAPYTVSPELLIKIDDFNASRNLPSSIHNQETSDENLFFIDGSGAFSQFYKAWGFDISFYRPSGKKSLPSVLPFFSSNTKLLLVHNTMTERDDIQQAHTHLKDVYWCFNPNANLYIEKRLPDFSLFIEENAKCTIGTDSLASNWHLSVLAELKVISENAPSIGFELLLKWSTLNGAEFLNLSHQVGSIEKGKKPGLNLIKNFNLQKMQLTKDSTVLKLV